MKLNIENVNVVLGKKNIVKDACVNVYKGEFIAVIGLMEVENLLC